MRKFLVLWLLLNVLMAVAVHMPSVATAEAVCPPPPTCVMDCRHVYGIFGKSEGGTIYCWWYQEPQGRTPYVPGPPQAGSLQPTNEEIVRWAIVNDDSCVTGCGGSPNCYPATLDPP